VAGGAVGLVKGTDPRDLERVGSGRHGTTGDKALRRVRQRLLRFHLADGVAVSRVLPRVLRLSAM
jgi:hypothetical protein